MSEEEKLLLEEMYPQVMEYLKVSMLVKLGLFQVYQTLDIFQGLL